VRAERARPGRLGLVVLVLALVTASCGIPTGGPKAIADKDVPFHLLSPTTPTTVPNTVPPADIVPEYVYLVSSIQTVAPVLRDVPVATTLNATLTEVLEALLEGPTATESSMGLTTYLTGTKVRVTARVSAGVATVDFSSSPVQVVGAPETLAVAQVVFTATGLPGVSSVLFEIAGQPSNVPTASGASVPGPVDRSSYQPQAPVY